jgi:RHS repeat-associated protein
MAEVTTEYVYDGTDLVYESGDTTMRYSYGPDGLITSFDGSNRKTYTYDALGSAWELSDEDGDETDTYDYDAWGNLRSSTGSTYNPFRYVGQLGYQYDAADGMYLLQQRYYDQTTGRFTTRDPAYRGLNWYLYSDDSPTLLVDPTGLAGCIGLWPPGRCAACYLAAFMRMGVVVDRAACEMINNACHSHLNCDGHPKPPVPPKPVRPSPGPMPAPPGMPGTPGTPGTPIKPLCVSMGKKLLTTCSPKLKTPLHIIDRVRNIIGAVGAGDAAERAGRECLNHLRCLGGGEVDKACQACCISIVNELADVIPWPNLFLHGCMSGCTGKWRLPLLW